MRSEVNLEGWAFLDCWSRFRQSIACFLWNRMSQRAGDVGHIPNLHIHFVLPPIAGIWRTGEERMDPEMQWEQIRQELCQKDGRKNKRSVFLSVFVGVGFGVLREVRETPTGMGNWVSWTRRLYMDTRVCVYNLITNKLWEVVKDREAWHATVHGVAKSWTWLSNWTRTTVTAYTLNFFGSW